MLRRLLCMTFAVCLFGLIAGCEENEYTVTDKQEIQTESTPTDYAPIGESSSGESTYTDVSPGEMIVE